jgi:hypothetical protein
MKIKDFLLERFFAVHEFSSPYLLCCSDCESFTVKELFDLIEDETERCAALNKFMNIQLSYTESQGIPKSIL